jgi:SAM-dependent methyltransferase
MEFMRRFAEQITKKYLSGKKNPKVLEIGSGSGEQLNELKKLGCVVLGIEPSEKLSKYANSIGIETVTDFFNENTNLAPESFDLVISSYTFDHIPQPKNVLQNIHRILKPDGLIITEIHDLELIKKRNEFCLFEHEHYIYLNENTTKNLLISTGFELLTFDLLKPAEKRANSLIFVAQKRQGCIKEQSYFIQNELKETKLLSEKIYQSIHHLENWLEKNKNKKIVAYGAGGRGVMTLAAIKNPERIYYAVDKNPKAADIFMPKSHIQIFNTQKLKEETVDIIIVFSFGYFDEIVQEFTVDGHYTKYQFISILDILNNDIVNN